MKRIKVNDRVGFGGIGMRVLEIGTRNGKTGITLLAPNGDSITIWKGSALWDRLRAI